MRTVYESFGAALSIFDNTPFRQDLEDFMGDGHESFESGSINVLAIVLTIDDYAVSSKFNYIKDEVTEKVLRYLIMERFGIYLGGEYDFKVGIVKVDNDRVRVYIEVVRLNYGVSDVDSNAIKTAIELVNGPLNSLFDAILDGSTYMSLITIEDPEMYIKVAKCDKSKLEEELESLADTILTDSSVAKFGVFVNPNTMEVKVKCVIFV